MPRRQSLEERLEELGRLRDLPAEEAAAPLRQVLRERNVHLVAKGARIAATFPPGELEELEPDLVAGFERLLVEPTRRDKGCIGKTAIARALLDLELGSGELFTRGARHVQLEPAFGGPVDTAAELRAACAFGLLRTGGAEALLEIVPLLADSETAVRSGAARALAGSGRLEAELLLRFKVLVGDDDPDVFCECCLGLLHVAPTSSPRFVGELLDSDDRVRAEAAALALGESRLEGAVEELTSRLAEGAPGRLDPERRRSLLAALGMLRREAAFDFLLGWVAEGAPERASEALSALAVQRGDERLAERLRSAIAARDDGEPLRRQFEREFLRGPR